MKALPSEAIVYAVNTILGAMFAGDTGQLMKMLNDTKESLRNGIIRVYESRWRMGEVSKR